MLGCGAGAREYVTASLMRVRQRISTNQFAHNSERQMEGEIVEGRILAPDQIKCFQQHTLESFRPPHQHVKEATYLRRKQFTQESNAQLKA